METPRYGQYPDAQGDSCRIDPEPEDDSVTLVDVEGDYRVLQSEYRNPVQRSLADKICIRLVSSFAGPREVNYTVCKESLFLKVKAVYALQSRLEIGTVRFIFDGERVSDFDTPLSLEMEDGDSIDVIMEQIGGSRQ